MARRDDKQTLEMAEESLAKHVLFPAEVKSFLFSASGGARTNRWYNLTWSPGTLTLTGDVGEMTITHYNALSSFEEGIKWAAESDYDYLLGKAGVRPDVLSKEQTVKFVLDNARETALYDRQAARSERQGTTRFEKAASAEWELDMAWWDAARDGPPPRLSDYRLSDAAYKDEIHESDPRFEKDASRAGEYTAPYGWENWYALYTEVYLGYYYGHEPKEIILTTRGRREITKALIHHFRDMRDDEVVSFLQEIGYSDYYGTYVTCPSHLWKISAIQRGCNLILDHLYPRRTWGQTWGDPVV